MNCVKRTTKTKGDQEMMKKPQNTPDSPVILSDELARLLKVSPNTLTKILKKEGFPVKPLPLGTRGRRWLRSEVYAYLGIEV